MFTTIQNKWHDILLFMKNECDITDMSYTTWIEPLKPYTMIDKKLYIIAPGNVYIVKQILKKYTEYLSIAVHIVAKVEAEPVFILESETSDIQNINTVKEAPVKDDFNELIKKNGLNPNFTFFNFVVGKSNELAHAASLGVAENPGDLYKILYLYGGVGLGKTHLMHAIAIYILKNNPSAKILYTTSENFVNEYINSMKNTNNPSAAAKAFRDKYRTVDVLLIDDIQFIAGKEGTQEEFFNTFNALYNSNKQIIISSDKPPRDINNLEERIKSRFEGGMVADIQSPNFETRMAILRKKEEVSGYNVDDEVIKYIATNIKSNIRTLEGALSRIVLKSKLENVPINAETAAVILKDVINNSSQAPDKILPKKIISVVSEHYHVSESDIISPKRNKELAHPRQIIMYLCCIMTESTLNDIGEALGNRDHATVIHGRDKISEELKKNHVLRSDIEILKKKIT